MSDPLPLILKATAETKGILYNEEQTPTFDVSIKAPTEENEEHIQRKSVDIICVIDVSGSMRGEPIGLVKETLSFMVAQLKDGDRISIVTFGDSASLVLALTEMKGSDCTNNNYPRVVLVQHWI